ncbi:TonB-dependent receptor plug domain-containing protein, partial [Acinetobacter geminorum]
MTLTKKALVVAISTLLPFAVQANTDSEQQGNSEPVQKLKTIVVSAALKEQDVDKAPASISVITSEEIERSAALSLADVLQKQAGVYNYNSGQDKIIIRGMQDTSG